MATNHHKALKNPAQCGIFCFRTLLSVLFLFTAFATFSQARLEVLDAKKNFGFVKRGEVVVIVYEIINKGNQPLIIQAAEVSCSCTTVDFPPQPIAPGQKAHITLSFNTKTVYGRQDRLVYVNSNDPGGPAKLRYKGIVSKS